MKVDQEKYFAGEALTWKTIEKVYTDVEEEKFSFLEPVQDHPEVYSRHKTIFQRPTKVNKAIKTKNASS